MGERDIPVEILNYMKIRSVSLCIFHLGGLVGQRLSEHPDIRKLGFTGSTPIGKQIMKRWSISWILIVLKYSYFQGMALTQRCFHAANFMTPAVHENLPTTSRGIQPSVLLEQTIAPVVAITPVVACMHATLFEYFQELSMRASPTTTTAM